MAHFLVTLRSVLGLGLVAALALCAPSGVSAATTSLKSCRLAGLEHAALCGSVRRPLDPAAPQGLQIEVHFAVLPALVRNKRADAIFVFAGGPGQSAIDLAGSFGRMLARLSNWRDIVLIDQRGTGRSAPLLCPPATPGRPLAEAADGARQQARLSECRAALQRLPHGDLRHYTTWVAMQDVDAVRRALGVEKINLVGASYGSRAALEYLRQFPQAVRRIVIDGVAPADMVLPASFSLDNQSAFDAMLAACEADIDCLRRHATLREDWRSLLAGLPREVRVMHPFTGTAESLVLTRELLLGLVRAPLYAPSLAAALPEAIGQASLGRVEALFGLASALQASRMPGLAEGMHFSVLCSEDVPRLAQAPDRPGADFGASFAALYLRSCADWPRGAVPPQFYHSAVSGSASLLLSGGADPVTPPRHGERVAKALGAMARHVVVKEAGHGVLGLACMRDLLFRFIDAKDDAAALALDVDCADAVPRPPAFKPVQAAGEVR